MFQLFKNSIMRFFRERGIKTTERVRKVPCVLRIILMPRSNWTFCTAVSFCKEYLYNTLGWRWYNSWRYFSFLMLKPSLIRVSQRGV